jgi:N-acyl homoserine lactone hydrolase
MRIDDVRRLDLGTFVRPAEETGTGLPRVDVVYGYVVRTPGGVLLLDTGLGEADDETEAWYRPRRVSVDEALGTVGLATADVGLVVNCHLHFDHIGGNPRFAGRPLFCQRTELETARAGDYTVPELVDFAGVVRRARRRGRDRRGRARDPDPRSRGRPPVGGGGL